MADADNYKIIIKDLALFVRNVQLSPAVRMGHVKASGDGISFVFMHLSRTGI
jgi:hypothetical protein